IRRQAIEQPKCSNTEELVQQAARWRPPPGHLDAAQEARAAACAIFHETSEDGVLLERAEYLAGHIGRKFRYEAGGHGHPFRMGAWVDEDAVLLGRCRYGADDLRLLTARDIRRLAFRHVVEARYEVDGADAVDLECRQGSSDIADAGGAADIRCLDPALPASDHARHQDGQTAVRVDPVSDFGPQHVGEGTTLNVQNAVAALPLRDDRAGGVGEVGAEIGRAP